MVARGTATKEFTLPATPEQKAIRKSYEEGDFIKFIDEDNKVSFGVIRNMTTKFANFISVRPYYGTDFLHVPLENLREKCKTADADAYYDIHGTPKVFYRNVKP